MNFSEAIITTITTGKPICPVCKPTAIVYYDKNFDVVYIGTKTNPNRSLDVSLALTKSLVKSEWDVVTFED